MNQHSTFAERHAFPDNPNPTHVDLAYRLADLLRVCLLASENDGLPAYSDDKGLHNTLKLAEKWADDLITEMHMAEKPARAAEKSVIASLLIEWRTKRADAIALGRISDEDTPEYLALCKAWEQTGKAIANATPSNNGDAAAMLQWCIEDADGGRDDAEYRKAHQAVIAYLGGVEAPEANERKAV